MLRFGAALAGLMMMGSVATAQNAPVVVELFTSQGCSSCPPADAFLHDELAGRDDVIALALHVDYWDYIGWKDAFADPSYTKRQKGYARAAGHRSVYTPQMIVGGRDHVVGNHPKKVKALIARHKEAQRDFGLALKYHSDRLTISAPATDLAAEVVVHLVRYVPQKSVDITRGENAGKRLSYANIVEDWRKLGMWDGKTPLSIMVDVPGPSPVVVLLQDMNHGPIVSSARLEK